MDASQCHQSSSAPSGAAPGFPLPGNVQEECQRAHIGRNRFQSSLRQGRAPHCPRLKTWLSSGAAGSQSPNSGMSLQQVRSSEGIPTNWTTARVRSWLADAGTRGSGRSTGSCASGSTGGRSVERRRGGGTCRGDGPGRLMTILTGLPAPRLSLACSRTRHGREREREAGCRISLARIRFFSYSFPCHGGGS